ncbi:hypothetical protein AT15_01520 [Kosmotoga arenicorallina S304]|uniref:Major facilitator superfamily (MFS) profile domain-containing protein n=1 Tax=Kosmotoga arenicorallina S304 TaxID=1453497 RepID=A0A176K077_9BACT|nr:MFS transporter [Kosmotoga arenicorallina]OAA29740.1 hypothetical protein AT15_01520 [Kosmotoga arenicorallina S304]
MLFQNFFFEAITYSSLAARNMLGQFYDIAGFSPIEIGYLMAMIPLIALISNPFWFRVGSKITDKKAFLIVSISSGILFWFIYLSDDFIPGLISVTLFSFFFSAAVPLGDSLMMASVKKHGGAFAKIRLFGTIGFAATALLLGGLVKWGFIWYFVVASASLFIAPLLLTPTSQSKVKTFKKPIISPVYDGNLFTFTIMIIGMIFGITLNSFHNTFFPVLSRQLGYEKSFVGIVYGLMAVTEIPFLLFAEKIIKKFGNLSVLIVGMFASALRVLLITYVTEMIPLLLIESLHGLTYILMYYTLFNYMHFRLHEKYLVNAQSIFWVLSSGVTYILGSIIGGYIIEFLNTLIAFRIMGYAGFAATGMILLIFILFRRKIAQ